MARGKKKCPHCCIQIKFFTSGFYEKAFRQHRKVPNENENFSKHSLQDVIIDVTILIFIARERLILSLQNNLQ